MQPNALDRNAVGAVPEGCTAAAACDLLRKQLKGSLRLINEAGELLAGHEPLPAGDIQVQVMSMADGAWCQLYSSSLLGDPDL